MLPVAFMLSLWSTPVAPHRRIAIQGNQCSLLTAVEIEAAAGAKPGASQETNMDAGNGIRVKGCMWSVPSMLGQVALSTGPAPAGVSVEKLMTSNAGTEALRAQHYTEETKNFGGVTCYAIAPPSSIKDGMFMTSCGTAVKGTIIPIVLMSPSKKPGIEPTKTLLDKAIARFK